MAVWEANAGEIETTTTPRREFWQGVRDTIPLMVGAAPFGLIFGALAVTNGLSPLATMAFSLAVFAGSAQFVAAGLVGAGVSVPLIILTTFIVNLRHALYSLTLGPHLKRLRQTWLLPLGFWLTDETFAVTSLHYQKQPSAVMHWYQLGSSLSMYVNWNIWTFLGLVLGSQIANPTQWGLQFAASVTFIGLVVPAIKSRPMLIAVLVSACTALLTYGLPNKLFLIVAALAGIIAGVVAENALKNIQAQQHQEEQLAHDQA